MSASSDASRCRCSASTVRRRERAASSLTTTAVPEYTASANQFALSVKVSVWTGGRKKKLNASMLPTATGREKASPQTTATGRTAKT